MSHWLQEGNRPRSPTHSYLLLKDRLGTQCKGTGSVWSWAGQDAVPKQRGPVLGDSTR